MLPINAILVSATDSVQLLRERFRAASLQAMSRYSGRGPTPFKSNEPDVSEFMHAIVGEIMDNGTANYAERPGVGPAAQCLIKDGMPVDLASRVSLEVFQSLVDEISTFAPNARFGENTGWYYEVEGDQDILITMPTKLRS